MSQRTPILCCSSYMNSLYTWTMRYGHTARNHSWCEANAAKLRSIHFWFKLIVQRQAALTVCVMGTAAEIRAVKVTPNLVRRPEIPCQRNPPRVISTLLLLLCARSLLPRPFSSSLAHLSSSSALSPSLSFSLSFYFLYAFFFVHPKDSGLCFHIIYIYLPKTLGAFSSTAVLEQLIIPHSSSPSLCPCVCTHTHTHLSSLPLTNPPRLTLSDYTYFSLPFAAERREPCAGRIYTHTHTQTRTCTHTDAKAVCE